MEDYIFVLWGKDCEEVTATLFVTAPRGAGLRVKLVGLVTRQTAGLYGLALVPDMTLEQALPLANRARGVVIPCGVRGLQCFDNDPRLLEFFSHARENKAKFVMGEASTKGLEA